MEKHLKIEIIMDINVFGTKKYGDHHPLEIPNVQSLDRLTNKVARDLHIDESLLIFYYNGETEHGQLCPFDQQHLLTESLLQELLQQKSFQHLDVWVYIRGNNDFKANSLHYETPIHSIGYNFDVSICSWKEHDDFGNYNIRNELFYQIEPRDTVGTLKIFLKNKKRLDIEEPILFFQIIDTVEMVINDETFLIDYLLGKEILSKRIECKIFVYSLPEICICSNDDNYNLPMDDKTFLLDEIITRVENELHIPRQLQVLFTGEKDVLTKFNLLDLMQLWRVKLTTTKIQVGVLQSQDEKVLEKCQRFNLKMFQNIDVVSGTNRIVLFTLKYDAETTGADIKKTIEERFNLNHHQQELFYGSVLLSNNRSLTELYLRHHDMKGFEHASIFLFMTKINKDELIENRCKELGVSVIECANVYFMNNELYKKIYFRKQENSQIDIRKEFSEQHNIPLRLIEVFCCGREEKKDESTCMQSIFLDGPSQTASKEIDLFLTFQLSSEVTGLKPDDGFNKVVLKTLTGGEQFISLFSRYYYYNPSLSYFILTIDNLKSYLSTVLGIPWSNAEFIFKNKFQSDETELFDLFIAQDRILQDGSLVMSLVVKAPKQIEIKVNYRDGNIGMIYQKKKFMLLETDTFSKLRQLVSEDTGIEEERIKVFRCEPIFWPLPDYGCLFLHQPWCPFNISRKISIQVYKNNELIFKEDLRLFTYGELYWWKKHNIKHFQDLAGRMYFLRIRPNSSLPLGKFPTLSKIRKQTQDSDSYQKLVNTFVKDDIIIDVVERKLCNLFGLL